MTPLGILRIISFQMFPWRVSETSPSTVGLRSSEPEALVALVAALLYLLEYIYAAGFFLADGCRARIFDYPYDMLRQLLLQRSRLFAMSRRNTSSYFPKHLFIARAQTSNGSDIDTQTILGFF